MASVHYMPYSCALRQPLHRAAATLATSRSSNRQLACFKDSEIRSRDLKVKAPAKFLVAFGAGIGAALLLHVFPCEAASSSNVHLRQDWDLALGPQGPLVEEFWENMRRYGLYFFSVATGGIYSLVKPLLDLLKSPISAVLLVVILVGTFYLFSLTLSSMLGITEFQYNYSP